MINFEGKKKKEKKKILFERYQLKQEKQKKIGKASEELMDEDFVLGTLGSDYRFEINVGFYKELEINI